MNTYIIFGENAMKIYYKLYIQEPDGQEIPATGLIDSLKDARAKKIILEKEYARVVIREEEDNR